MWRGKNRKPKAKELAVVGKGQGSSPPTTPTTAHDFPPEFQPVDPAQPTIPQLAGGEPSLAKQRETAREWITKTLVIILGAIIAAAFATIWLDLASIENLVDVLTIIFGPVVTLVGAATGFYYGEKYRS